ncbi:oxidoreductase [Streptosporangium sp. NPDC004631]
MTITYARLFAPIRIGGVELPNRVVQPAHTRGFAEHGRETERDIAYYLERVRGGAGLVYAGGRAVHRTSDALRHAASAHGDLVRADRAVTGAVHAAGGLIFAQLNHFGVNASSDGVDGLHPLWGASDVPSAKHGMVPVPIAAGRIDELVGAWARAAAAVRLGGYDGLELLMGHGYLVHQFLSRLHNRREDDYGGSLENRARLGCEILAAVRRAVGDDFPLGVRISLQDSEFELTFDELAEAGRLFHEAGALDFYHLSGGTPMLGDGPWGATAELGGRFRAVAGGVPVMLSGGILRPEQAEAVLAAGHADLLALARAQIADPHWAAKAREGRAEEITHCVQANQGCFARARRELPMSCTVNPLAGRERRYAEVTTAAARPARWLVVGGGPAGLKAAATLAGRGHDVSLVEAGPELGGQLLLARGLPGVAGLLQAVDDLAGAAARAGVRVGLGTRVDVADVLNRDDLDRILVATGAVPDRFGYASCRPHRQAIPGHDRPHVHTGFDALRGRVPAGSRVLVLDDDGGRYAAAVCERLLADGSRVEVVTARPALFEGMAATLDQAAAYARLMGSGLTGHTNTWCDRLDTPRLMLANVHTGELRRGPEADHVVLASRRRADDALFHGLAAALGHDRVVRVGDCVAPRRLDHALYEGHAAGLEIDPLELEGVPV